MAFASLSVIPSCAVTSDVVMTDSRGVSGSSNWMSREVTIPRSFEPRFPSSVEMIRRVLYHSRAWRRTSDRDAREALGGFDAKDLFDCVVWPQHNRRGDEAVLVKLDGSDHCRLGRDRLVVMDDSDSSQQLTGRDQRVFHNLQECDSQPWR
jgi:hypothetical protein